MWGCSVLWADVIVDNLALNMGRLSDSNNNISAYGRGGTRRCATSNVTATSQPTPLLPAWAFCTNKPSHKPNAYTRPQEESIESSTKGEHQWSCASTHSPGLKFYIAKAYQIKWLKHSSPQS